MRGVYPAGRPRKRGWHDAHAVSIFAGMDAGATRESPDGPHHANGLPGSFFELVRLSDMPVLVNFWAEWCGPCRTVSPTIERLARENLGHMLTVKVNVDRRPQVAQAFEIQGVPTIMLFWKGEARMRLTGAYPYESILQSIQESWPRAAGVTPHPAPGT